MKFLVIISVIIAVTSADTTTSAPTTTAKGETTGSTKAGTTAKPTTHQPTTPKPTKKDVDVKDKTVQEMASFAFDLIVDESNSPHAFKLENVTRAQTLAVNGVEYYLTLNMGETDCVKVTTDLKNCTIIDDQKCDAVVLYRPLDTLHQKRLLSYQCIDIDTPFDY